MSPSNAVNHLFLNQKVVQITTNYAVLPDDVIIEVGATSTPITITLPLPSSENKGKFYIIKDTSGKASVKNILINYRSTATDAVLSYIVATDYGSLELFSNGNTYFNYLETSLSRGVWVRNSLKPFDMGTTKTDSLVTDWDKTPAPLTARLDLSALTKVSLINLLIAEDSQSITFTQAGLYQIVLNSTMNGNTYALLQLIKNSQTLLFVNLNYPIEDAQAKPLQVFYLANFSEGDTLDFRYGLYKPQDSYQFLHITLLIQQLSSYK